MFLWLTQVILCPASLNFCFRIWWAMLVALLWVSTYRGKWSDLYLLEPSKPSSTAVLVHSLTLGLFCLRTLQESFDDSRLYVINAFTFMEVEWPYFSSLDTFCHGNDGFLNISQVLVAPILWWIYFFFLAAGINLIVNQTPLCPLIASYIRKT